MRGAGVAIAGAAASVVAIFATGALITVHARRIIKRCAEGLAWHLEWGRAALPMWSTAEKGWVYQVLLATSS